MGAPNRYDMVRAVADMFGPLGAGADRDAMLRTAARFTVQVAQRLHTEDPAWGLVDNRARGHSHIDGLSADCLMYRATGDVIDIVASAGAPQAGPCWYDVGPIDARFWVAPPSAPDPTPSPPPTEDLAAVRAKLNQILAALEAAVKMRV